MEIPTEVGKLSSKLEFSVNFECFENFESFKNFIRVIPITD